MLDCSVATAGAAAGGIDAPAADALVGSGTGVAEPSALDGAVAPEAGSDDVDGDAATGCSVMKPPRVTFGTKVLRPEPKHEALLPNGPGLSTMAAALFPRARTIMDYLQFRIMTLYTASRHNPHETWAARPMKLHAPKVVKPP
jgi:hypothetical protein